MTKKELKEKLSVLLSRPELKTGFLDADHCGEWIDDVAPLLKYDDEYYKKFKAHSGYLRASGFSADKLAYELKACISVLRQAVISLDTELPSDTERRALEAPAQVTMGWLWRHLPAAYVWAGILALGAAFMAGYNLGVWKAEVTAIKAAIPTPADATTPPISKSAETKKSESESAKK